MAFIRTLSYDATRPNCKDRGEHSTRSRPTLRVVIWVENYGEYQALHIRSQNKHKALKHSKFKSKFKNWPHSCIYYKLNTLQLKIHYCNSNLIYNSDKTVYHRVQIALHMDDVKTGGLYHAYNTSTVVKNIRYRQVLSPSQHLKVVHILGYIYTIFYL